MTCAKIRERLPGYLDGALPSRSQADARSRVREHLESCAECRKELERYRQLSALMSRVEPTAPPPDLAVRIRVAVAEARATQGWLGHLRRWQSRAQLFLENILEPLALPAAGGFVVALVVFGVVTQLLGLGMPLSAAPNDVSTNLLQPARLVALAPFSVSGLDEPNHSGADTVLLEATIDAQGEAVNYEILSGPNTPEVRRQLDQLLLFSRFRPQMSFGRPTPGGRVLLSFSEVHVKG